MRAQKKLGHEAHIAMVAASGNSTQAVQRYMTWTRIVQAFPMLVCVSPGYSAILAHWRHLSRKITSVDSVMAQFTQPPPRISISVVTELPTILTTLDADDVRAVAQDTARARFEPGSEHYSVCTDGPKDITAPDKRTRALRDRLLLEADQLLATAAMPPDAQTMAAAADSANGGSGSVSGGSASSASGGSASGASRRTSIPPSESGSDSIPPSEHSATSTLNQLFHQAQINGAV